MVLIEEIGSNYVFYKNHLYRLPVKDSATVGIIILDYFQVGK